MLERYLELLLEWNQKMNLTAITDPAEIRIKHFEDSLTCLKTGCIKEDCSLVDVGTGAGFPGLPIKIELPGIQLTLMDSLNKRLRFLQTVTEELGLQNVTCVHIRAEDAGKQPQYREQFDVAVSRAVANMRVLAEYCLPLVKQGGYFLAMKGKEIGGELEEAKPLIEKLGGKVSEVTLFPLSDPDITHSIVVIQKNKPTPPAYPRISKNVGK